MPQLNITERLAGANGAVFVLSLNGSIDAYNSELLAQKLESVFSRMRFQIIVDCRELLFISSSGMGVFLSIEDQLLQNNGGLKFINVSEKILNVFQKVGIADIFKIYDREADALQDLEKG